MRRVRFHHEFIECTVRQSSLCPYCDGRLERRNDDDLGVLQTRLQEFHTKTEPLGAFYKKLSMLHRVDGNRDRDAVFADIGKLIENKTAK